MFCSKTKKVVFKVTVISAAKGQNGERYYVKIGKDKTHSYCAGKNGLVSFDIEAEMFYRRGNLAKAKVFLPEEDKVILYREGTKGRKGTKVGETVINYMDFLSEPKTYADFTLYDKDKKQSTLKVCVKRTWKHEYDEPDKNANPRHEGINDDNGDNDDKDIKICKQ